MSICGVFRRLRGLETYGASRPGHCRVVEPGVDGDRDPDLPVERSAERVLEARAQPALELVAGEVVRDRDDRSALVQCDRLARGEPGALARRQVVDQLSPHPAQ